MASGLVSRGLIAALGAIGLVLAMAPSGRAQAPAQPPVILTLTGEEAPDTVRRMVEALSREGRQVEIRISGTAPAKAGTAASKPEPKAIAAAETAETTIDALVDHIVEGIDYGTASVPRIGELGQDWERAWLANRNGTTGPSASARIGLIILLALAVAGAFRLASASWFRRRMQPASETFTARLVASSWGLLQDGATILLALMLARLCRNLWLPEADLASIALTTLANGAAIGAVYAAVGRFLLAPGADQRRLMPMPRAERHFRLLMVYAVVTPVIIVVLLLAGRVGSGPHPLAGLLLLSGLVALLFKLWWFHDMRRDLAALILGGSDSPGPWRRLIALAAPWFYMATAVVLWAVGRAAAMMSDGGRWAEAAAITQTAIVIIPIIAVGIGSFVDCRAARRAVTTGATPLSKAAGAAFRAAAVGVLWAAGFYVVARLWAGLLVGMSTAQFGTVSRQAAGVAVFAFAGWVALVFLRVFFDACAPKRRASGPMEEEEEGHADSVPSRLATVLPVLRGVVLGAVLGLTILIVLSRLGVDIGPLLAGFGILGLALSFGSQALVRDIVSGVFFMLEDAFRVGEYVDTGRLKGTVEKISLRSMQLRHQSGQIHTIPFGQIQQLTNASRDWATIKFNVRLDHSADIEQARKTIKKVGLALLEDPEFGPHFIAQLKMQGVADITDSAVVIRLKFTAKPAQASTLQREALKRVYRALNEAKVPFASNAVTVRGGEGSSTSGAAAIAAVPPPSPLAPAAG
ncbi:mechanosensitive ion channel family protein [Bosea sp. RAC05]|uniref:mechanosensitive ion channel family protein n=1 Tax=Bosea sp. RAC05 TaxID=1842539 RepID=UPI00085704E4|nr:mechanosensitive ion channel family protein [Bosea sp. RAC05]AOG06431.1 mechanosensitive ion channel family protein [Bosea sp. RAC05]